jgi:hypothetical protein
MPLDQALERLAVAVRYLDHEQGVGIARWRGLAHNFNLPQNGKERL